MAMDKEEKAALAEEGRLWIDYAVEQVKSAQKKAEIALDSAFSITISRLSLIRSTSSAHFTMTLDSLQDLKSNCNAYEDIAIGKIKEGMSIVALHPFVTSGVIVGSGFLMLKGPRHALYYRAMHLFYSEQALNAKAQAKFNGLQKSIQQLEKESEDMKKIASLAEEQMKRGKTKLRQAGNQIRVVIRVADKVEREAAGLKLVLKEVPGGTSSILRSEVSNLTSEAKRERHTLNKVVTKISNYGIPI